MRQSTWMEDHPSIHDLPLRQICLPVTHDSGASALTNPMIGEPGLPETLVKVYNLLPEIAEILSKQPRFGLQLEAVVDGIAKSIENAVQGLATSNSSSIAQQLNNGIRGLDLRITHSGGIFYTYHGLRAISLDDVLQDLSAFLGATQGEVVYVTFGHYEGFAAGGRNEQNLLQQLNDALGDWAYAPALDGGGITNDVFAQTWSQIVNSGGSQASKVILVNGETPDASGIFWPQTYSPPDSDDQGMAIYGKYTNTTDLGTMLSEQTANFCQAQASDLPFALYMTLTPSGTNYTNIILASVAEGLELVGEDLAGEGAAIFGRVLEAIATDLEVRFPIETSWTTLEELSAQVGSQLNEIITSTFAPAPGQPNGVSMLYLDFYENTSVVDLAISLSTGGLVRSGASPCS